MELFSYVVRYDNGSAPNPFWGLCTLAICKPQVRLRASVGDWIVGTGSVENVGNHKLIYAMEVTEKLLFDDYYEKYRMKIPLESDYIKKLGDNIYYKGKQVVAGNVHDITNFRNKEKWEEQVCRDLSGKYVLISENGHFYYYGKDARDLPAYLWDIEKKGPNYKRKFSHEIIILFLNWIRQKPANCEGIPYGLKKNANVSCGHLA